MAGLVNKVKEMLHSDKDTTNSMFSTTNSSVAHWLTHFFLADPSHSSHTTGHTANPADRNNDGKVDARDVTGQHGATGAGGLTGHSTAGQHGTANPADRNNDGRVDARDLTGQHGATGGLAGHNTTSHGTTGGLTGHTANPADRNNDGRVDARDLTGRGATSGLTGHNTASHGTTGGLTGHTANPVDRNNDGRVDARDLTGHSTTGHSSSRDPLAGALAAPLGTGALGGNDPSGPHNTRTANILDPHVGSGSHGHSGTTGSGLTGHGTTGGLGHTANPADRNNDGRVDARDLTGQGHSTGGLGH
jgi:hypothetical protein